MSLHLVRRRSVPTYRGLDCCQGQSRLGRNFAVAKVAVKARSTRMRCFSGNRKVQHAAVVSCCNDRAVVLVGFGLWTPWQILPALAACLRSMGRSCGFGQSVKIHVATWRAGDQTNVAFCQTVAITVLRHFLGQALSLVPDFDQAIRSPAQNAQSDSANSLSDPAHSRTAEVRTTLFSQLSLPVLQSLLCDRHRFQAVSVPHCKPQLCDHKDTRRLCMQQICAFRCVT